MVRVAIMLPGITREVSVVDFLVDTGAMITTIHPRDAIVRLGIDPIRLADPGRWPTSETIRGVGGTAVQFRVPAQYGFVHEDDRLQVIAGDVRIAQLRAETETLPSLLGWDILRHFQLITDWSSRLVMLREPKSPV
jgi:hypothetical protein